MKGEKGIGGAVTATDGLSEELTEEAFSKQRYDTFMQLNLFLRVMYIVSDLVVDINIV